jgi:hypothetical protein
MHLNGLAGIVLGGSSELGVYIEFFVSEVTMIQASSGVGSKGRKSVLFRYAGDPTALKIHIVSMLQSRVISRDQRVFAMDHRREIGNPLYPSFHLSRRDEQ